MSKVIYTPSLRYHVETGVWCEEPALGWRGSKGYVEWSFSSATDDREYAELLALAKATEHEYVRVVDTENG